MKGLRPGAVCGWLAALMLTLCTLGCDVHEFPEPPGRLPYVVRLQYQFENMFHWEMLDENDSIGNYSSENIMQGIKRFIIRIYPRMEKSRTLPQPVREFVLYGSVYEMYGCEHYLDLPVGDYTMMVWADFVNPYTEERSFFYDADDFSEIFLCNHMGSTDYRDAFMGVRDITVLPTTEEHEPETIVVDMQRPLAKFEVISEDFREFVQKEFDKALAAQKNNVASSVPTRVKLDEYRVVLHYAGFMPDTYSMVKDKPVDSSIGRSFESSLRPIPGMEDIVSLGFDYMFVNGTETKVPVMLRVYNKEEELIASSPTIDVPLRRGKFTIVRGSFLTSIAQDGVGIVPDFNGEYNLEIK